MAHPVTHFEINARDTSATQGFYRDVFGWAVTNTPQNYGIIDTKAKGSGINGGIAASRDPSKSWVTFYIESPDLDDTLRKVERAGGRTVLPPMDTGGLWIALFADPEGNVIGLAKMTQQAHPRRATRKPAAKAKKTPTKKRATTRKTTARKATARPRTRRR